MQAGDHLESQRLGYTHHGLYIGAGRVIHYAGLNDLRDWNNAAVQEVSLAEFEMGKSSVVLPHPGAKYSPEQSVQRAQSRLGEDRYKLASNNCEHFVHWCIDGEHRSEQVEASLGVAQAGIELAKKTGTEAAKEAIQLAKKAGAEIGKASTKIMKS